MEASPDQVEAHEPMDVDEKAEAVAETAKASDIDGDHSSAPEQNPKAELEQGASEKFDLLAEMQTADVNEAEPSNLASDEGKESSSDLLDVPANEGTSETIPTEPEPNANKEEEANVNPNQDSTDAFHDTSPNGKDDEVNVNEDLNLDSSANVNEDPIEKSSVSSNVKQNSISDPDDIAAVEDSEETNDNEVPKTLSNSDVTETEGPKALDNDESNAIDKDVANVKNANNYGEAKVDENEDTNVADNEDSNSIGIIIEESKTIESNEDEAKVACDEIVNSPNNDVTATEECNVSPNNEDSNHANEETNNLDTQGSNEVEMASDSQEKHQDPKGVDEDVVMLDDDNDGETGIEISGVTSQVTDEVSNEESGIKISSVESQSKDSPNEEQVPKGGLKISSIASLTNDNAEKADSNGEDKKDDKKTDEEVVQLDDDDEGAKKNDGTKKPLLKLASFADMGKNGMAISEEEGSVTGKCQQCLKELKGYKSAFAWETMQFCDEDCLGLYQEKMNHCSTCKVSVQTQFLGKYCVRFGSNIKQFCSNKCLEDHKKGLKVCCYCQKDISSGDGFLAPIGNKGQFKDFCVQECLKKFEARQSDAKEPAEVTKCAVCSEEKPVEVELIKTDSETIQLCGLPCLGAYKFANNLTDTSSCDLCKKEFILGHTEKKTIFFSGKSNKFCSEACQNVFVMQAREIVPCSWCKVRKYNFDMIEKFDEDGTPKHFCSVNCYKLLSKSGKSSVSVKSIMVSSSSSMDTSIPVIQSVSSLAGAGEPGPRPDALPTVPLPPSQLSTSAPAPPQVVTRTVTDTIVKFPEAVEMKNKSIGCKPYMATKGVSCRPHPCHKGTQTDLPSTPALLPITLPMYLPIPMQMYQRPYPVPIPVPIPVPVPIFIPTTRNSMKGIEKTLRKMKAKMPSDPLEAELLALAGSIDPSAEAGLDDDEDSDDSVAEPQEASEVVKRSQRKKMSTANSEGADEDIENVMAGRNIVPKALPQITPDSNNSGYGSRSNNHQQHNLKRRHSGKDAPDSESDDDTSLSRRFRTRSRRAKQAKPSISSEHSSSGNAAFTQPPKERPDAKHHLKFTYGVNAWRHWVVGKNAELEKARAQGNYMKPFETDILKLRADELNYTLCLFVKEVRKPNGDIYASDSIFYLALGIQEYLSENGRIENIFTDPYYDAFTTALNEVVKDFKLPTNELGYFVTRIEEEHLWEAKQLGAHSPQVLLNTLVYFNAKYFMLKTTEEHKRLSFTHIMKHYKKGGTATPVTRNSTPAPGEKRTLLLRYYPPNDRSKSSERKCYEVHEIPEPTRCPVKLYEFYLSKCPENVRTRSDLFYLQPERSCVPDSPVWYSTHELNEHQIDKMLRRVLMVREVQEHMLADGNQH